MPLSGMAVTVTQAVHEFYPHLLEDHVSAIEYIQFSHDNVTHAAARVFYCRKSGEHEIGTSRRPCDEKNMRMNHTLQMIRGYIANNAVKCVFFMFDLAGCTNLDQIKGDLHDNQYSGIWMGMPLVKGPNGVELHIDESDMKCLAYNGVGEKQT